MHGQHVGTPVRIDGRERDRHLSHEGRVRCLELVQLHHALIGDELDEAASVRVGKR